MTTFYLIRHGENDWIGRRLPGWSPGLHLNERGRAQALALVEVLRPVRFAAIYTSHLDRARETAAPLGRARRLPPRVRSALADPNPGRWQGQRLASLRRRRLWSVIERTPSQARFPGGESFLEVQARVVAELEAIAGHHRGRRTAVACFTHGDPIRLAVAYYLGLPIDLFQRIVVEPASITVLHVADGRAALARLNDTRAGEIFRRG